ncbi:hypothetical protein A2Z22_02830 [Candidatus Woesebacteria bacterium RBG_16_34_12]|uniref:Uncharacterized protein n=1 Tax=Candidatus Woesebacteria bacterium RBG_16_34_12 TaxID=1802480 RepID=A0A1F7X6T5_9BACT|nr:MAG: hypothetical protein A2Z22_02830 [Candidatus Woesebacteria bacterium RBG_16_34_12]
MDKIAVVNIADIFQSPFGHPGFGLGVLVSIIVSNAMIIASLILLFLLIFGGISIIIGAGAGNPESTAKGKKAATSALIGFLIIFAAYWIIQIIEKITGMAILSVGI